LRIGRLAGLVAPPLLVAVLTLGTMLEWHDIRSLGWSASRRSDVQWPSVLLLGHLGWLVVACFVLIGALGMLFAAYVINCAGYAYGRLIGVLIFVIGLAVALEAFRPDHPRTGRASSWHDQIHNGVFPAIPIAAFLAAALVAIHAARRGARVPALLSVVAVVMIAVGIGLGFDDNVAQIARYLLIGSLVVWLETFALHVRHARA
jgi:hypothetical protein